MSILNTIFGNEQGMTDRDIVCDMIKDSKAALTGISLAASDTVNPELRNILGDQLDAAIREHFELSDIAIRKGWYPAYDNPQDQLNKELRNSYKIEK
jgi:similar to spore coat protein